MKGLFENEDKHKDGDDANSETAWLCFAGGKKIKVQANGKCGIYYGYLSIVDGLFSVANLNDNCDGMRFFVSDNVDIELGKIRKCKPTIVMAESFLINEDNNDFALKNIVLVSNFQPEQISLLLDGSEEYKKFNNIKCCLYFENNASKLSGEDFDEINNELDKMPNKFQNIDLFIRQKVFNPYLLKKDDQEDKQNDQIPTKKLCVAILDFGVSHSLKWLLNEYFDVAIVPYNDTLQNLLYLYKDKKIDGVVIPDFYYNTAFIDEKNCNEIKKIIDSKIPVLSIANGAIFVAELFGSQTKIDDKISIYNTFPVRNVNNKIFYTTITCDKMITNISTQLHCDFFDLNGNIVGYSNIEKNVVGYTFSLLKKNDESDEFISRYIKIIQQQNKNRKEVYKALQYN